MDLMNCWPGWPGIFHGDNKSDVYGSFSIKEKSIQGEGQEKLTDVDMARVDLEIMGEIWFSCVSSGKEYVFENGDKNRIVW